ncbi:centromere protein S [Suricata suricatta]|uniref:centromere protein S n=1 Tax=Suricata suricatta TaxID=37032 RepID=UPI0011553A22|nr:centromere protein S [Suricata suricatta]
MEEDEAAEEQQRFSYRQVQESRAPAWLEEDGVGLLEREGPRGRALLGERPPGRRARSGRLRLRQLGCRGGCWEAVSMCGTKPGLPLDVWTSRKLLLPRTTVRACVRAGAPAGLTSRWRTPSSGTIRDTPLGQNFARDLEMFARHAKRSTINTEDVKLLARRSNSLLKYITEKSEELTQFNSEQRAKKKKKSEEENKKSAEPAEAAAAESDPSTL